MSTQVICDACKATRPADATDWTTSETGDSPAEHWCPKCWKKMLKAVGLPAEPSPWGHIPPIVFPDLR